MEIQFRDVLAALKQTVEELHYVELNADQRDPEWYWRKIALVLWQNLNTELNRGASVQQGPVPQGFLKPIEGSSMAGPTGLSDE